MKSLVVVMAASLSLSAATAAYAQSPANRVPGRDISGTLALDAKNQVSTETMTLTFRADNGGPTFTVDFTVRRGLPPSAPPPEVVDVTVTELPADDSTPAMTLRVDGQSLPLVTRMKSRRAMVSTISLDQFVRLTTASSIVENAFMSELEFGPAQLSVLRSTADKWAGRR